MKQHYKATFTSGINFGNFEISMFRVLQKTENIEKTDGVNQVFVSGCRKIREVNFVLVSLCQSFCGVAPVYTRNLEPSSCISVQGEFL